MQDTQDIAEQGRWSRLKENFSESFSGELLQEHRTFDGDAVDERLVQRQRDAYRYIMLLVVLVLVPVNVHSFLTWNHVPFVAGTVLMVLLLANFWLLSRNHKAVIPLGMTLILTIGLVFVSVVFGQSYSLYWLYPLLVAVPVLMHRRWSLVIGLGCAVIAFPLAFDLYTPGTAVVVCLSMLLTWVVSAWLVFAVTLQTRRLRDIAVTDPLTGAYNRRYFQLQAQRAREIWLRYQRPSALLLIDVDWFKRINDRFGHDVGDQALKTLVNVMQERVRSVDTVCRFGGEEFVVLLNETGGEHAMRLGEDLRAAIEATSFLPEGNMTISIGVCDVQVSKDMDHWLKLADGALYLAKNSGRNRVEQSAETAVTTEPRTKTLPTWR
jgi:diguanylate cyclase (GGDEF)-like protein